MGDSGDEGILKLLSSPIQKVDVLLNDILLAKIVNRYARKEADVACLKLFILYDPTDTTLLKRTLKRFQMNQTDWKEMHDDVTKAERLGTPDLRMAALHNVRCSLSYQSAK